MAKFSIFLILYLCSSVFGELVNRRVSRRINLEKHYAKIDTIVTILNNGDKPKSRITILPDPILKDHLATFLIYLNGAPVWLDPSNWEAQLPSPIEPEESIELTLEEIYTHVCEAFPKAIKQSQDQLMKYKGNLHHFSPYVTKRLTTKVTCPSEKIFSYLPSKKAKKSGNAVTYEVINDVPASSSVRMEFHYQANIPFITTHYLNRQIEVSHWGNINIKDNADIRHVGAKLDGSFNRVQYTHDGGDESNRGSYVPKLITKLPVDAQRISYRDAIGIISSSKIKQKKDSVEVQVYPRTPLFGGWKSEYTLAFNLPSEKALFYNKNDASRFTLKLKAIDELYVNQVVDEVDIDIILPEGASDIQVTVPAGYSRGHDEVVYTYLDMVTGRPVIKLRAENLAGKSLEQMLEVSYSFDMKSIAREPMMTIGFFMILFVFVMFIVRLDLTIGDDGSSDVKQRINAAFMLAQDANKKRIAVHNQYQQALTRYKETKDIAVYNTQQKQLRNAVNIFKNTISDVIADHKAVVGEKLDPINGFINGYVEAINKGENGVGKLKEINGKINTLLDN